MNIQNSFDGTLGEEYDVFELAVPHYREIEGLVAQKLVSYLSDRFPVGPWLIAEPGAGSGITTRLLLEADERVYVTAIEKEAVMVAQALPMLQFYGARAQVVEADCLEVLQSYPDGHFHAVASGFMLHNVEPAARAAIMAEVGRVIRPGGYFVNADKFARNDEAQHQQDLAKQIEAFKVFDEIGKPYLREEWELHYREDEKIKFSEAEQYRLLVDNGFIAIETPYRQVMDALIVAVKQ